MEIIVQWVTQIILFIILATIIDLLIPTGTMKKYIKLVVGLILILILLNPIFYILNTDMKSLLSKSFHQIENATRYSDSVENLMELQKKEIESTQDAYILEQMAVQLIDIAKDPLKEAHEAEITDIQLRFQTEGNHTYEDLKEVIVYVKEFEEREGEMSVVEDVVINTEEPLEKDEKQQGDEKIKSLLMDVWELQDKEITIYWEGGSS